jgi:hypothetical protein
MEKGFLLTKEEQKKKKEELRKRLKHKIKSKKLERSSRKYREKIMRHKTDDSHSSQNIMNCVVNLQQDCIRYNKEKNKVKVCQMMEKKHKFLQKNYFHIYRQVCYGELKDLKLLQQMLNERDRFTNPKNNTTVEDSSKNIGEILTKKYCPDLEEKIKDAASKIKY